MKKENSVNTPFFLPHCSLHLLFYTAIWEEFTVCKCSDTVVFGRSRLKYLTTTGWIALKFVTDIQGPLRINSNDSSEPLTSGGPR